ncbi:MAG: hypothetical protein ACREJU_03500 [Nitrospiraceae bacterium]
MNSIRGWIIAAATAGVIGFVPFAGYADDFNKGSRSSEKGQIDKSNMGDRGEPGKNMGGQDTKPGEGEQTGRPGTSFGAPATLSPSDKAPQHEGAGKQKKSKKAPTAGGPD